MSNSTNKSNGVGTAGFILALCGVFFGWIPVFGWIVWLLGLILSAVGVFRKPRGLSMAGLVVSLAGLVLLFVLGAAAIVASL